MKIPFTGLQKQYNRLRAEVLDTIDIVLRSGQLMDGNYTQEFEFWLAKRNHNDHAITVASGTQALEALASYYYKLLNLHRPQVIIPNLTFRATANAWVNAGWEVVVADTDNHGMLDINSIPKHHANNMAVCLVGLYGNSLKNYRAKKFKDLVAEHDWILVEDAAQHWLSWNSKRIAPSAISFDPTKNLANYGNGGAVITDSKGIDTFVRNYRSNGKHDNTGGTNSRMSEIDYAKEHCFHKFVIDADKGRGSLQQCLREVGIDTKVHYQYGINEIGSFQGVQPLLAASTSLSRRVLSLPIYPELTDLEVEYVIDQVIHNTQ